MGAHHHHNHDHSISIELPVGTERYRQAQRVTLIGSFIDFALGVAKIVVGYMANSQALIADGIHSFSDLLTDALVLVAAKHGSQEADEEHPYGHGRFETIATVMLGAALIAVAVGIAWGAIDRLFFPEGLVTPGLWALLIAVLSVLLKEWIYRYTMRVARALRSKMLEANAWHSRSDAISSIIVVIGVGGTMLGLDYLDAIAAVGVSLMVAKIGWDLAWQSVQELADTSLESEMLEDIRSVIMNIDGVRELHMLRTRRMGHEALVDVHVIVQPWLTVSEGHMISVVVEQRLKNDFDEITDVVVHIDPEDDEEAPTCQGLPLREKAVDMLMSAWSDIDCIDKKERVLLHYLKGKIDVELFLPLTCIQRDEKQASELQKRLIEAIEPLGCFGKLSVYYR